MWSKDKKQKYQKRYYAKWHQRNKERVKLRHKNKVRKLRLWLEEYKRTLKCFDCGFEFKECPGVCDFHHSKLEKINRISALPGRKISEEKLLTEIDKCIPLCANCHRIRHNRK